MKCHIPQISWHNRDPVLSIDYQKLENSPLRRIATAGTDTRVFIWLLNLQDKGTIDVEFVADLNRHTRAVNAVRFSPNGGILASADDEACIILWKMQNREENDLFDDNDDGNKEHWVPLKILRGHIDDICDICWSKDNSFLISGSVDNTAIMWDVQKGKNVGLLGEHKGFVQGVAWDPVGNYLATLSSDRTLRIYSQLTKRTLCKVQKAAIPGVKETSEGVPKSSRIFYDDTLKTFCRRLAFSPDGEILVVPSGIIEQEDGKFTNASYVFSRHALNRPVMCLPTDDKFTVAVRCCPILFTLRHDEKNSDSEMDKNVDPIFNLPYRIVFAVATQNAMLVYDSQHMLPISHISNIHYTRLTDLAWSSDAKILMASSTDGYCSFVIFEDGELGIPYKEETPEKLGNNTECNSAPKTVPDPTPSEENKSSNVPQPAQLLPIDTASDKTMESEESVKSSNSISLETTVASVSKSMECKELVGSAESIPSTTAINDPAAMECMETEEVATTEIATVQNDEGKFITITCIKQCDDTSSTESTHSTGTIKATDLPKNENSSNKKVAKVGRRIQLITIAGRDEK